MPRPGRISTVRCRRCARSAGEGGRRHQPGDAGGSSRLSARHRRPHPGDVGQSGLWRPELHPRLGRGRWRGCARMVGARPIRIEVDGGVSPETAPCPSSPRRRRGAGRAAPPCSRAIRPSTPPISPPSAATAAEAARRAPRHPIRGKRADDPRYSRPEMVVDLVAGDALPHLVRDRGPCARRAGRDRHRAEIRRRDGLGQGAAPRPSIVERIDEIERTTKHDVIAFLTHLAEIVGRRCALRASGHDLLRRARHLPQHPACARRRSS